MSEVDLFERDGFTMSITTKFENKVVTFTQWEAKCYQSISSELEHLQNLVRHLRGELHSEREHYLNLYCKEAERNIKATHDKKN